MINEVYSKETTDIKNVNIENYKDIKPNEKASLKEVANFWDGVFSRMLGQEETSIPSEVASSQFRELNNEERQEIKDALGWSDKKLDDKCSINEEGVIKLKTDCQDMEGKTAECGVIYERNSFEYNGIKLEGIFPVFESKYDTYLPNENLQSSSATQFEKCNQNLKKDIFNNPDLEKQFTKEQLDDIKNGITPRGYTWHHHEEPGRMQLVKTEDHDKTIGGAPHTGGNSIWGNKSIDSQNNNSLKGETF